MQTAGANNHSLPPFSLNRSTFIHTFLTHTSTCTHKLLAPGLGLSLLSCPLPCLKSTPSQSFSSYLSSSRILPRLHAQLLSVKHASSLHFADNYTHVLHLLHTQPYSMKLGHIPLLQLLLCFSLIISPFLSLSSLCT